MSYGSIEMGTSTEGCGPQEYYDLTNSMVFKHTVRPSLHFMVSSLPTSCSPPLSYMQAVILQATGPVTLTTLPLEQVLQLLHGMLLPQLSYRPSPVTSSILGQQPCSILLYVPRRVCVHTEPGCSIVEHRIS